jgi:hypothetical protein
MQAAQRLQAKLRSSSPADDDVAEMIEWAGGLDESVSEDMAALIRVLPWCKRSAIRYLWAQHRSECRRVYQRFCEGLDRVQIPFEYCDVIADFGQRAVIETEDSDILRITLATLMEFGRRNNRWHVRDVVVEILQGVKTEEAASAAVEALHSAQSEDIDWSLSDFASRTLPSAIRAALQTTQAT